MAAAQPPGRTSMASRGSRSSVGDLEDEPPVDVQTSFDQCYVLTTGKEKASNILASTMLETLKRVGFRGDLKQMNAWIRETYGPWAPHPTEKTSKKSITHPFVMEKLPGHKVAFQGFKLKSTNTAGTSSWKPAVSL